MEVNDLVGLLKFDSVPLMQKLKQICEENYQAMMKQEWTVARLLSDDDSITYMDLIGKE